MWSAPLVLAGIVQSPALPTLEVVLSFPPPCVPWGSFPPSCGSPVGLRAECLSEKAGSVLGTLSYTG